MWSRPKEPLHSVRRETTAASTGLVEPGRVWIWWVVRSNVLYRRGWITSAAAEQAVPASTRRLSLWFQKSAGCLDFAVTYNYLSQWAVGDRKTIPGSPRFRSLALERFGLEDYSLTGVAVHHDADRFRKLQVADTALLSHCRLFRQPLPID